MERPIIKAGQVLDYVLELEKKLEMYEKSPFLGSYLACKTTLDRWNTQLQNTEINILEADQKPQFDMCHKYLTEQKPYIEQLEYLRGKMTAEEKREADGPKLREGSVAEKYIFNK